MKPLVVVAVMATLLGCGPDKNLLMETKFDEPLRDKMMVLSDSDQSEELTIIGKCITAIDGPMRQALVDAGADVKSMKGDSFEATVSSDDVFHVAALEFVTQVQLPKTSKR
jgi:hypothetical protein